MDDLDYWEIKIKPLSGLKFIHAGKACPRGQRVMRVWYIVEVTESMVSVAKRFLAEGLSIEETSERTMFPGEFIEQLK